MGSQHSGLDRLGALSRYRSAVSSQILNDDDTFVCSSGQACQDSAHTKGFGFAAGQLSYVGPAYEAAPFRVLVVSMQVGDAEAPVTIERRAEQIGSVIKGKRNPHMRGVARALRLLFGCTLDTELLADGTHVLDAYAMDALRAITLDK